ncbi:MAG: RAMP superfamily CRISPR-associated protein [Promethearchaeota archaeon]
MINLFKVNLKTKAPIQIGTGIPSRNILQTYSTIPSTTLWGAIASKLLIEFCSYSEFGKCHKCLQTNECVFYDTFYKSFCAFSPGIPLHSDCGEITVPPHEFQLYCKRCKEDFDDFKALKTWISKKGLLICPTGKTKTTLTPIRTFFCRKCKKRVVNVPRKDRVTVSSVNRKTLSVEEGMLYTYEYIELESNFGSIISLNNEKAIDTLVKVNSLALGRGRSRGFGDIEVSIKSYQPNSNNGLFKTIQRMLESNKLILAAKSPIFSFNIKQEKLGTSPIPPENLTPRLKFIYKFLTGTELNDNFDIRLDKTYGDITRFSGWSLRYNQPKPHITAAKPGSLFLYNVKNLSSTPEILNSLAHLEIVGFDQYSRVGFNIPYFPNFGG